MAAVQPNQVFYSLSLIHSSAPTAATVCNVIPGLKSNDQQIFEARGSRVYLRRIIEGVVKQDDPTQRHPSTISTVLEQDVFSIVRGVGALRIPGSNIDHLVISSDSGRLGLYSYDAEDNRLKQVHLETFGKSGIRRTVPGQYLAVDPRGRCLMLASTEKNKLVYIFQRLPDGSINISSPHEANTWATLTFDLCPLHVGWEHPIFATLEVDYSECESDDTGAAYQNREKVLSFYTVDLGLNHVVRTWSERVDYTAHKLFGVPGGTDGPSGVLVCAKGRIYYKHEKFDSMSIAIPRRTGPLEDSHRDRIIASGCLVSNKALQNFFFLLQTEDGDMFKLSMEFKDETSWDPVLLKLRYFDTTPLATSLLSTRRGYLYVAAEHDSTKLYRIQKVDEEDDFEPYNQHTSQDISAMHTDQLTPTTFQHRELENIAEMQSLTALHPLIRTRLEKLIGHSDTPQILALQGAGSTSRFKMIQHGISTEIDHSFNAADHTFDRIFTIPASHDEPRLTKYIVCSASHEGKTMVLELDEDNISSMDETPFIQNRSTILALLMGSANIQVHARGIHSILRSGKITEWPSPANRTISSAAGNRRQLLVGLSSGELAFFYMQEDGVLSALELEEPKALDSRINCMAVQETPYGQEQARFAVVGTDDCLIRIVTIDVNNPLEDVGIQAVSAPPSSIVITDMHDPDSGTTSTVVHIGLVNGLYLRGVLDEVTGELSNVRSRVVGTEPVRIFPVDVQDQHCVVICTSKVWIGFHHPVTKQFTLTPFVDDPLDAAACLYTSERISLCGCRGTELRFFRPGPLDQRFVTDEINLQYTPRNMARYPNESIIYVAESDGNTLSKATEHRLLQEAGIEANGNVAATNAKAPGHWASCIQVLDPVKEKKILATHYLSDNEAALCCAVVHFESKDNMPFLVVGTGRDMHSGQTAPGRGGGCVHVYQISEDGRILTWLHRTEFEKPIYALAPFKGRLAMGVGNEITIYDLGTAHILRKARGFGGTPNAIISIITMGNRIICGDVSESATYIVYNEDFNRLVPFVDDTVSRWTTAIGMLDYDTVAGGDKFGNLWIARCPEDVSRESDDQGVNGYIMNERPYMGGTPYRLENRAHFFCQDIPTSIQKGSLSVGGAEVLFWSGLQGTMGILTPFVSRTDVTFFTQLEIQMRQEYPPLTGRDHLAYRGYYSPVRAVIDGDLCERFMELHYDKKQKIAAEVDREVPEVEKKIQEMRTRVAF